MFRQTVLPLALIGLVAIAFAAAAWSFTDGGDLAGIYFALVAIVALRAVHRIARAGEA